MVLPVKQTALSVLGVFRQSPIATALLAVAALLTFASNIQIGFWEGTTSAPPTYDDVVYLMDGFKRVYFAPDGSLFRLLRSYVQAPPISYWSTSLAAAGYTIFGPHIVSPYLMNVVPFAIYVAFFYWLARDLNTLPRLALTLIMLFVPIGHILINEFRPEMAAGLFLGIAIYALATFWIEGLSWKKQILLALFIAFAATIKPSSIILTVPVLGFASLAGLAGSTARIGLKPTIRAALPYIATLACLFGVFLLVFGQQAWSYVSSTLTTTGADFWNSAGAGRVWTYHLTGDGGRAALWPFFVPALILLIWEFARSVIDWRNRDNWQTIILVATLLVLYVAVSVNPNKSVYPGSFFYFPFLTAAFVAATRILARWKSPANKLLYLGLALTLLLAPIATLTSIRFERGDGRADLEASIVKLIRDRVAERRIAACPARNLAVTTLSNVPLVSPSIALSLAIRDGTRLSAREPYYSRDREHVLGIAETSDFVLVPSAEQLSKAFYPLPTHEFVPDVKSALDADPNWQAHPMPWASGGPSTFYVKTSC